MPRGTPGVYSPHLREANDRKKKLHSFKGSVEGKVCSFCKEWKDLTEFHNNKGAADGLGYDCKICVIERRKDYESGPGKAIKKAYNASSSGKSSKQAYKASSKGKERRREYEAQQRISNLPYRIKKTLSERIRGTVLGKKSAQTRALLGCSIDDFLSYVEEKFQEGMNWGNYGLDGWEIDHIRPCASFDLTDPEAQSECFHYSNLQPLWASDNRRKGDRW